MNKAEIVFFGQRRVVACDRKCSKAWGINNRPRIELSDEEDDYAYLADDELENAPIDPGTYEGGHAKPLSPDEFPNKWCVRECERCAMDDSGGAEPELPDLSHRYYNMPWLHDVAD